MVFEGMVKLAHGLSLKFQMKLSVWVCWLIAAGSEVVARLCWNFVNIDSRVESVFR